MLVVGQIVPQEPTVLLGYNAISLHANHRDLIRYKGPNEHGFELLLGKLQQAKKPLLSTKDGCVSLSSYLHISWAICSLHGLSEACFVSLKGALN
jgi:hypothetical protein